MDKIRILLSGLPGRMCSEVAHLLDEKKDEFEILDLALVGEENKDTTLQIGGKQLRPVPPSKRSEVQEELDALRPFLLVDYTLPSAVEKNVQYYCEQKIPFVMGTTGGDFAAIRKQVEESEMVAVVAPNMAIPIILIQAAARWLTETFPGALTGYEVGIRESHQSTKVDTSGTAKALAADLAKMGLPAHVEDIEKVRDSVQQKELGVPEDHLAGHAYHTYSVYSPDRSVALSLSHNVNGRRVYAEGTAWALRFLYTKVKAGDRGRSYDMQDVLRAMDTLTTSVSNR